MKKIFNLLTAVPVMLLALSVHGQGEANAESTESNRLPYEVIVTPNVTRADLRQLIIQVEEDFFAKFNELNIDEDYDVACYKYTPTMSHITKRVCEPWFMIRERGLNASNNMDLMRKWSWDGIYLLSPEAMRREVKPSYEVLQEKMEAFTKSDIEFRSIGEALLELKARLANFGNDS